MSGRPTVVTAVEHWRSDYAAAGGGITLALADAVDELNTWIQTIDTA